MIDVYDHEGKTQIALLHLLDDDRWRIFTNAEFKMPGFDVDGIRACFEVRCSQEPIPELVTKEWLDRGEIIPPPRSTSPGRGGLADVKRFEDDFEDACPYQSVGRLACKPFAATREE